MGIPEYRRYDGWEESAVEEIVQSEYHDWYCNLLREWSETGFIDEHDIDEEQEVVYGQDSSE
jgi:hypothetical protein